MTKFNEELNKIKEELKDFLTTESKKEDIDKMSNISKMLDGLAEENKKTVDELSGIKDDYLKIVRNTAFAKSDDENDDTGEKGNNEKSFADLVSEFLAKKSEKEKN